MTPDALLLGWSWSWHPLAVWTGALLLLAYPLLAAAVHRRRQRAPRLLDAPACPSPPVAVLLPLRDEEDDAEPCIRSLLAQSASPRVVAIDDGSTDRTPEVLAALRQGSDRLDVVQAGPLPPGWRGKVHALRAGHRALTRPPGGPPQEGSDPEWLLLTDADTRHHPDLVARAVRACGEATGFFRAPDLLEVRMYRGLRESVAGWRRNLAGIFGSRPGRGTTLLAALVAPAAVLVAAVVVAPGAALAAWGLLVAASAVYRRSNGNSPAWALLAPLELLIVAFCLAGGLLDHRRGRLAPWKGRIMPLAP